MRAPDPRKAGASKYYGLVKNPECIRCEYKSHPVGRTTKDGPICTHCINQED